MHNLITIIWLTGCSPRSLKNSLGAMYKPREQMRGVAQMTTILNNIYLVKVSTVREGVKIAQNSVHMVCIRPLLTSVHR